MIVMGANKNHEKTNSKIIKATGNGETVADYVKPKANHNLR